MERSSITRTMKLNTNCIFHKTWQWHPPHGYSASQLIVDVTQRTCSEVVAFVMDQQIQHFVVSLYPKSEYYWNTVEIVKWRSSVDKDEFTTWNVLKLFLLLVLMEICRSYIFNQHGCCSIRFYLISPCTRFHILHW